VVEEILPAGRIYVLVKTRTPSRVVVGTSLSPGAGGRRCLTGHFLVMRPVLPQMIAAVGSIINIASIERGTMHPPANRLPARTGLALTRSTGRANAPTGADQRCRAPAWWPTRS